MDVDTKLGKNEISKILESSVDRAQYAKEREEVVIMSIGSRNHPVEGVLGTILVHYAQQRSHKQSEV